MKRIFRGSEVPAYLGVKITTVDELRKTDETFPKPIKLTDGGRAIGFLAEELDAWIEKRKALRDGEAA
jgi:prophage regulatory protein